MSNIVVEVLVFFKTFVEASRQGLQELFTPSPRPNIVKAGTAGIVKSTGALILYFLLFPLIQLKKAVLKFYEVFKAETLARFPRGRYEPAFQNRLFIIFMVLILLTVLVQDASDAKAWRYFVVSVVFFICYYAIMSIALNLQTGTTGIVNFGVIFFVGIGMVATGIFSTQYGVSPILAMVLAMIISASVSYLLAFLSLRLRTDYFAIVTIALGELLKAMMLGEPLLQTKRQGGYTSIGVSNIPAPMEGVFTNEFYSVVITIIAIVMLVLVYIVSEVLLKSPYGRVLRAIREDEDVVEAYGYNVFFYKASVLAIGGAIFSVAGSLWVWSWGTVFPGSIDVTVTFYVWAAFIIGGKGNNKGMILGAAIIATLRTLVTKLSNVGVREKTILGLLDAIFRFIVVDIGGGLFGNTTWRNSFVNKEEVIIDLNFAQTFLVGVTIIFFLRYLPKGILPEEPFTPKHRSRGLFEDPDLLITKIRGGEKD